MFKTIDPLQLNAVQSFSSLKLDGSGGMLTFKIPAFTSNEEGVYKLGIYDNNPADPGYVFSGEYAIAPYARYISTYIPPGLALPVLGVQLVHHADIDSASINVKPSYHLECIQAQQMRSVAQTEWERTPALQTSPSINGQPEADH